MIQIDMKMPECCGNCPCFHFENPMYCRAIEDDHHKRITTPYRPPRPDWCPLLPVNTEMPKKAEWTTKRTQEHDGKWYCSHCGYEPVVMWGENFCPNCGYKMTMPEPPKEGNKGG